MFDEALADRLIAQAQADGIELLGEGGLLKQMTKATLESLGRVSELIPGAT